EEFKRNVGKKWDTEANNWMRKASIPSGSIPDNFDWRDHGAVTPVKNQQDWRIRLLGWAIKKNKLLSLSEQGMKNKLLSLSEQGMKNKLLSLSEQGMPILGVIHNRRPHNHKTLHISQL
ncbi:hypothetical protein DPMN_095015, partial [Dreissena polymorpha]